MKRHALLAILLGSLLAAQAFATEPAPNPLHPLFAPLDADGVPVLHSKATPDSTKTCGACHDVAAIAAHQTHAKGPWHVDCARCHWPHGTLPTDPAAFDDEGRYTRRAMKVAAPNDETCASCHVLTQTNDAPLSIPESYAADFFAGPNEPRLDLTQTTGAIFSAQAPSASALNLAAKEAHNEPWDVHAKRLVGCIACHYAPNNPTHESAAKRKLPFLTSDPRRLSFAAYLRAPDHRLTKARCESCHDPLAVHDFLPFKNTHLRALECQSCHAPMLFGPALKSVDATVLDAAGLPPTTYRGYAQKSEEAQNAGLTTGYTPFLLATTTGGKKLAPFNVVTHSAWIDAATGKEVTLNELRAATFDGRLSLSAEEPLRLDTPAKQEAIAARLKARGVAQPQIRVSLTAVPIAHGTQGGALVTRRCDACHAEDSRLDREIELAAFVPPGATLDANSLGTLSRNAAQGLSLKPAPSDTYVVGHTPTRLVDGLGFALFVMTALGAAAHGAWRLLTRKRRVHSPLALRRAYLYGGYERLWHWLMAASILVLLLSGFAIHTTGAKDSWPLSSWVSLHHLFALILTVNAALSLFYHLATSAIRQFLPPGENLPGAVKEQLAFYLRGIFLGQPHPTAKTETRKMNPLQQLTYLGLLNVLFPFQLASGALLYLADAKPHWVAALGGLGALGPLHTLGSWLFLSFFVMHLYLTTTGHTPLANIRAMVTGYDELEDDSKGGDHA